MLNLDDSIGDSIGAHTRKIGTLQHFRWLKGVVVAVLVMNLLDAVFTIIVVTTQRASEANPVLAELALHSPPLFMFAKMLLVSFGSYTLWGLRRRPFAVCAIFVAFLTYYCVLLFHLHSLDTHLLAQFTS